MEAHNSLNPNELPAAAGHHRGAHHLKLSDHPTQSKDQTMSFFGLRDITVRTIGPPIAGITFHPAITERDRARMSPTELLYFLDTSDAHVDAFEDFKRQTRASALAVEFDTRRFERFIGAGE